MTPWYRKKWTGGLFGRYEAPTARKDLIQQLLNEIRCLREGWNGAIAQHDALLERYRGLSREVELLNQRLDETYSQRDAAVGRLLRIRATSLLGDMVVWLLGAGAGALAMFTVMWVFGS